MSINLPIFSWLRASVLPIPGRPLQERVPVSRSTSWTALDDSLINFAVWDNTDKDYDSIFGNWDSVFICTWTVSEYQSKQWPVKFHKIFPSGTPFAAPSALRTLWNNRLKTWESPFSEVSLPRALFYDERHTLGKPSGRLHGNWIPSAFAAAGAASGGGEACPWIFFSEYDI